MMFRYFFKILCTDWTVARQNCGRLWYPAWHSARETGSIINRVRRIRRMMGENAEDAGVSQQEDIHGQTRNRINHMVDTNDKFWIFPTLERLTEMSTLPSIESLTPTLTSSLKEWEGKHAVCDVICIVTNSKQYNFSNFNSLYCMYVFYLFIVIRF